MGRTGPGLARPSTTKPLLNTKRWYGFYKPRTYIVKAFETVTKQIYSMNTRHLDSDTTPVAPSSSQDVSAMVITVRDVATVSTTILGPAIGILLDAILLLPVIYRRHSSAMLSHLPVNLAQTWTALYRSGAKFDYGIQGVTPTSGQND